MAAKAGDESAFGSLYLKYAPRISRSVGRMLSNPEDRDDAVQDCFLKAHRHLDSFAFRSAFSTWITRIGINSALMILRKHRTRGESSVCMGVGVYREPLEMDFEDRSASPEETYIRDDLKRHLRRAVRKLPGPLRTVVEMHHASGASIRDISNALNLSEPAVKSRLLRARLVLQQRIAADAGPP